MIENDNFLGLVRCHVIVLDQDVYNSLPEPTDEENDMLDLAFGLTETYSFFFC